MVIIAMISFMSIEIMPPLFLYIASYPVSCSSCPAGRKMLRSYTHYPIIARLPGSTREKPEDRAISIALPFGSYISHHFWSLFSI